MIAILGTGKMGEALLSGLLRAGRSPADVAVGGAPGGAGGGAARGLRGPGAHRRGGSGEGARRW